MEPINQRQQGYTLPIVITAAVILMAVGVIVLQYVAAVSDSTRVQYQTMEAYNAAMAGMQEAVDKVENGASNPDVTLTNAMFGNSKFNISGDFNARGYSLSSSGSRDLGAIRFQSHQKLYVPTPMVVDYATEPLSVGGYFSCVVAHGDNYCWGETSAHMDFGQPNSRKPILIEPYSRSNHAVSTAIVAGLEQACTLLSGIAYCWGNNEHGQYGDGGTHSHSTLTRSYAPVNSIQLATDGTASCSLNDGKVWCWGSTQFGQLGNGNPGALHLNEPLPMSTVNDQAGSSLQGKVATQIARGYNFACALASGKMHCWGKNSDYEFGTGPYISSSETPIAQEVATSSSHPMYNRVITKMALGSPSCVISEGKAWCWGKSSYGVGDGTYSNRSLPVQIATNSSNPMYGKVVTDISTYAGTACAVASGKAYCWGANHEGKLGNGTNSNSNQPVAVHAGPGSPLHGKVVTNIKVGQSHVCAIANGMPYCWGSNYTGQLGDNTNNNSNVPVEVYTGPGSGLHGKTVAPSTAINNPAEYPGANGFSTCSIIKGRTYCWGRNTNGELGNGNYQDRAKVTATLNTADSSLHGKIITQTDAENMHTCALAEGKVHCWGSNSHGQLGNTSVAVGLNTNRPVEVDTSPASSLHGKIVTQVSVGNRHTCALAEGKVHCWGADSNGQLGAVGGGGTDRNIPVAVNDTGVLKNKIVTQIDTGNRHTCALADGKVYCWGQRTAGQAGDGHVGTFTGSASTPSAVVTDSSSSLHGKVVTQIAAGNSHTCALADGQVHCWGSNDRGQLGNNTTIARSTKPVLVSNDAAGELNGKTVVQIASEFHHSCLLADAKVYCWGNNNRGQLGNTSIAVGGFSNRPIAVDRSASSALYNKSVTRISTGDSHTCALSNGAAYCWGFNNYGQLGDGTTTNRRLPVVSYGLPDSSRAVRY